VTAADDADALWATFSDQVRALGDLVFGADTPDDELHRAEGLRYLLRYLAAGIATCVEFDDTLHPELGSLIENRRSWGLDNPDTKYSFCRLEPGATYVLRGDPGTATDLELQVDSGHFADGRFTEWQALGRWSRADLPASGHPPPDRGAAPGWRPARGEPASTAEESGRAIELAFEAPAGAGHLHLREYFGDWERERPALFTIERVGAPYPPPPLSLEVMSARMELLGLWLTAGASCWADLGRGLAMGEPGPITPFLPPASATGLAGQAYGMGAYDCGPDEAVVIELRPPECRYWSVSLATWFWESSDIANRQNSLNHTQAVVDPDGIARIVVAQRDPGVANWLDAAGYRRGTLAVRFLDAATDGAANTASDGSADLPTAGYRTVPLAELAEALPPSTVWVDAEQRATTLRRRRDALVGRYRR